MPSSAENWKPAKPSVSAGVISRGAIATPSSDIRLRKRDWPSVSGTVPVIFPLVGSRLIQLHSDVTGSGGHRFSRRRSFLPARARPSPKNPAIPTAQRRRGRRRALGKAIAVYGTVWRRRVSRKARARHRVNGGGLRPPEFSAGGLGNPSPGSRERRRASRSAPHSGVEADLLTCLPHAPVRPD